MRRLMPVILLTCTLAAPAAAAPAPAPAPAVSGIARVCENLAFILRRHLQLMEHLKVVVSNYDAAEALQLDALLPILKSEVEGANMFYKNSADIIEACRPGSLPRP